MQMIIRRSAGITAALVIGAAAGAAPAAETGFDPASLPAIGEPIPGETLPAEALGKGYVEGPAAVEARERASLQFPSSKVRGQIGQGGKWQVPSRGATYQPHSGQHYATNKWGDTKIGIGFRNVVDVQGTWIAGQSTEAMWAPAVRVVGYFQDREIAATDWFENIGSAPVWFEIGLAGVDRIVFEAKAAYKGGGWFAIDDFAYTPADGTTSDAVVLDFEDCGYRKTLTGSGYADLIWEPGSGHPAQAGPAMPPPWVPEGYDGDAAEGEGGGGGSPPPAPMGEGTLPEKVFQFIGARQGEHSSWSFPPDTCGAVGPNHFVEVVNNIYRVFNKDTGQNVQSYNLHSFLPGSQGDPRVLFDQHSGRWIIVVSDYTSRIYLAISLTDNPTGSWYKTSFIAAQGSDAGTFPDYPTLGVNDDGIYTCAMMAGKTTMSIFAIDKAPLLDSTPSLGTITAWRNQPWEGAIQPCHTYGDPGREYLISRPAGTYLKVRQITGPMTSPSMTNAGNVAIPSASEPPDAPAKGSTVNLDTVGGRCMNAVYRDGFIYTAHCISYSGKAAARWYKVDTTNWQDEYGTVSDPSLYFFFPSIMVNSQGDILMAFTGSDSSVYAGCYYTGRKLADPTGEMADPVMFKGGTAPYNNIDGYGRNRWGDYSLCSLDPDDELSLWTIQEFGYLTNVWGTWIAKFQFDSSPIPENNACEDAIDVGDGSYAFTTLGATTDGPDEPEDCDFYAYTHIESDVWFRYLASADGPVTVDICDSDYNTKLAVYKSSCPGIGGKGVGCDDRSCDGLQSTITFDATAGNYYRIRIGGYAGDKGSGTLQIVGSGTQCPADINGDDVVDVLDLLEILSSWGDTSGPADINGDGIVDVLDLLEVLSAWGPC